MTWRRTVGLATVMVMVLSATLPAGTADYEQKTELEAPDVSYYKVVGPPSNDTKGGVLLGGGAKINTTHSVSVNMTKKGSSATGRGSVTFPYEKFNWSIDTWYLTDDGLRFYGVFFEDEKILWDYRTPWVVIDDKRYALTSSMVVDGPDLYVWNFNRVFKVWVKYHVAKEDADVQVYAYFYEDGEFDPWAIVDCESGKDVQVGQRFDFDLGGCGDDNAQFYTTNNKWELVEEEDDHFDSGQPEDDYVQWVLADTDRDGMGFITDQLADIIPYHPDDSYVYILRYHGNQVSGTPSSYDNDEATGVYRPTTYDPYIGYDLVAWYVSDYSDTKWCNPGPWILLEV